MITELGIGNFKAFGETQRVPIKPLTLIFGANSSGKSSILHSLLLAHHGMETGEYDVRQTKLAGDLVDLGGFRSYVHKHDSSKTVRMLLETDIDHQALMEHLDGNAKEKAPFLKLSRFGLSLTVAGGDGLLAELERECWPALLLKKRGQEAVIHRIVVLIDGEEMLAFSPEFPTSPLFRAQPPSSSGNFLGQVIRCLAELPQAARSREDAAGISSYSDLPQDEQTASAQVLMETAEGNRKQPISAEPLIESDLARLKQAFAEAITDRCFHFLKLILRDDGYLGPATRPSAKWRIEQEGAGLLDFYQEATAWEFRPWRAEAQVLSHNLSSMIEFCTASIAAGLRGISYLGPLRCVPPRDLAAQGIRDPQMLPGGELAWELLCREPAVIESVNRWLGPDRLGTRYRLKHRLLLDAERVRRAIAEGGDAVQRLTDKVERTELLFEDLQTGTVLSHRDIGFGVGQVLPVLASASALRRHLIVVEQPEAQLHPAQQAELGDVFIESALGERKNTFLLETHSEHLILRVMRRIRETTRGRLPPGAISIRPSDVAVLYVERDGDHSIVREMPLNERGELVKAWPKGFFEEAFNELFPEE